MNKIKTGIKISMAVILPTLFLCLFFWSAWTPRIGWCPESSFRLSPDSRLPKWFSIPSGYNRKDLSVIINFYTVPGIKATLLGPPPGNRKLDEKTGSMRWHPTMEKKKNKHGGYDQDAYPMVTIETIDGITEILEQRKAEDILYVSDDPELIKTIGQP
jgi:hypothetical protein